MLILLGRCLKRTAAIVVLASLSAPTIPRAAGAVQSTMLDGEARWAAVVSSAGLLESYGEIERALELLETAGREPVAPSVADSVSWTRARLMVRAGFYDRAESLLACAEDTLSGPRLSLNRLVRARLLHFMGRDDAALSLLRRAGPSVPSLFSPYHRLLEMEILNSLERFDEALEAAEPGPAGTIPMDLELEWDGKVLEALAGAKRKEGILRFVERLKGKLDVEHLPPFLLEETRAALELGLMERAVKAAVFLASRRPGTAEALDAVSAVMERTAPESLDTSAALSFAEVFMARGRTGEARTILDRMYGPGTSRVVVEEARLLRAKLLYIDGDYSEVLALLETGLSRPDLAQEALLLEARTLRAMRNYEEAAETYSAFSRTYPSHILAPEALLVASELFEKERYDSRAEAALKELVSRYPRSSYGRTGAVLLALEYMKQGRIGESIDVLRNTLVENPSGQEALLYYLSRSLKEAGDETAGAEVEERLRSMDRFSFYLRPDVQDGLRLPLLDSRGRMVLFGRGGLMELLERLEGIRARAYETIERCLAKSRAGEGPRIADPRRVRASFFLRAGFSDWAGWEIDDYFLSSLRRPRDLYSLASMCTRYGFFWRAMRAFTQLKLLSSRCGNGGEDSSWRILEYPVAYPGLVLEHCVRYRFPPQLAFAIIREESRFDSGAVSRAGALGLMQIMPETGRRIASEMGFPMGTSDDLLDPEVNISFGMHYADKLLRQYSRNYHMMLAAYNAGMKNASRWFDGSASSIQESVDRIGFAETRNYIKRIVESSHVYTELLAPSRAGR